MKKQLLNLSFVAFALALYAASSFAAPVQPVRTDVIPAAIPAPEVMDGLKDDCYSALQTTDIFNPTGYDGESDFTASFYYAWDPTYLYILAEITDDVKHEYHWSVGNPWEFDNIEFFLMLDTNTVTTSYSGTTAQLRVCRGLDSVETASWNNDGRCSRADYIYYMETDAPGGWISETAIPWTAVLADGAAPEDINDYVASVIGFDFSGADSDNSDGNDDQGNRDVQSAWDMDDPDDEADRTEDNAWNNTSVFGFVTLAPYDALDEFTTSKLNAYPNPATNAVTFDIEGLNTVEIYNITGQQVMSVETTGTVDISALESGVYVARIGNQSAKFVVK